MWPPTVLDSDVKVSHHRKLHEFTSLFTNKDGFCLCHEVKYKKYPTFFLTNHMKLSDKNLLKPHCSEVSRENFFYD